MTSRPVRILAISLLTFSISFATRSAFCGQRVLPEGSLPDDVRLAPLKDLDGYFPFIPPASKEGWAARVDLIRRRILVSQGLWPMPHRTPLNPVIHGRIDQGEYTVEKVFFESAPGFFVTGNLYRPTGRSGKVPGILFAHGHWADARLSESTDSELLREIATGEERFENGGRSRFQSLCVQLARMGCVVWQWDMLGNSDAQQLSADLVHGFRTQRPEMNSVENWGLFSPQAEAHLQSAMGLQTWNSIRSLDFLLSLPEVDAERIAITGASGGGTQTMLLAAIDPRVTLSFPAVMVSTAMQGGCTCENACLLRVDTGNVEFAALFAPKPQGMTTANDWTKEMATKGFPQLRQLYALLGAEDKVMLNRGEHFPHNYNAVSRSAFYGWVNRHFNLRLKDPVIERDYPLLHREQLTVWDTNHPAPQAGDPEFEKRLLRWFHEDSQKLLAAAAQNPDRFRQVVGSALETLVGRTLDQVGTVEWELVRKTERGAWTEMAGLLKISTHHEELPVVFCYPKEWNGTTIVWLDDPGKSGLFSASGTPTEVVQRLIDSGITVVGADLLYQGEFLRDDKPLTKTARVKNPREAAAFSFGYNHTVFAHRVHDILSIVKFVQSHERRTEKLCLVGLGEAGPCVAAARPLVSGLHSAFVQADGFRFSHLADFHHPAFLPGGAKYGDLPGILSLGSSGLLISGETTESLAAFGAVALKQPQIVPAGHPVPETAATWLLEESRR